LFTGGHTDRHTHGPMAETLDLGSRLGTSKRVLALKSDHRKFDLITYITFLPIG
jgi:hypothetical protein